MKTQFKVINRESRQQHIMNASEVARFFKLNTIRDYAVSTIKPTQEKFLETLLISCMSLLIIVLTTKLFVQWILFAKMKCH
jgi:hypothetical protein